MHKFMRVCGRCEATIRLTAKFCGKCGFQQRKDTSERETPYIKPSDREQVEKLGFLELLFLESGNNIKSNSVISGKCFFLECNLGFPAKTEK